MPADVPVIDAEDLAQCCTPVTAGVIGDDVAVNLARMFKALGDPTRVKLLSLIATAPDGEACVCDLTAPVNLSQPTVSHHMKQLVEAGLATGEKRGRWTYYRIVPPVLASLSAALDVAGPEVNGAGEERR